MTHPELAQMVKDLDGVLRKYAVSGAVSAAPLDGWVITMATVLYAYKRTGDSTLARHNTRVHEQNMAAINKEIAEAETLIDSMFVDQETRERARELLRGAKIRKAKAEEGCKRVSALVKTSKGLPKVTRHDLIVFIIAVWKAIKNTDVIPRRRGERNSKNSDALATEFFHFLDDILSPLGVYDTSIDELHKQILLIEKVEQEAKHLA